MKLTRWFLIVGMGSVGLGSSDLASGLASLSPNTQAHLPANFQRLSGPLAAEPMHMEVLSGVPSNVQLRFSNPPLATETVVLDDQTFSVARLSGEGSTLDPGAPDLPRVSRLVMISNTGNVELTITDQSFTIHELDHPPAPAQPLEGDDGAPLDASIAFDGQIYSADEWYPPVVAEIMSPATLRDVRFVVMAIYPVQVNPVTNQMRVYDRIEVSIDNIGGVGENEINITPASLTPGFKRLYTEFPNFRGSSLDELPVVPGKQLIICGDDVDAIAQVQRLVDWRRRKGVDAYYATTTQTGGTASQIRTYITNQYSQSNGTLEFVTIVGDPNGPAPYNLPAEDFQLDNYYGTVGAGNPDPVPDLAVGRLPARSSTELFNLVSMLIQYESDPLVTDTTWFTRAWCYSHYNVIPSNPSMKRYTQQIMLQHGMTTVNFDSVSGGVNPTTLNTRVNQGVCVVNHRLSWIGQMNSGDVSGLANGRKLPFVMAVTCETGSFNSGSAVTEDWVRLGTAASPRGAIGCVGMSGSGTHVQYNNIVDAGVMYGLYVHGIREQGIGLVAGKLQLYKNYAAYGHMGDVQSFCYWSNLMGDPGVSLWLAVPRAPVVIRPPSVHRYTDNVSVSVNRAGSPVEGALVGLLKGTETFARGYTDATGNINLAVNLPTTGYLHVTVTKEGLDSYLDSVQVVSPAASLSFFSNTVDDDNTNGTIGDGNGVLNPGETIDLNLRLQNTGTISTVTGISATLTTPHPGVQITGGTRTYTDIPVGGNAAPSSPYRILVGAVFNNEPIPFYLTTTSSVGTQLIRMDLTPVAGDVAFVSSLFNDANSRLDPGETGSFSITFQNSGSRNITNANGILRSLDSHVTVNDSTGTFGTVNIGANGSNVASPFNVSANVLTVGGYPAQMQLVITDANGFRDSTTFVQTVGVATPTTPTGPDAHGYYAYDNTETQPGGTASLYLWTEIAPGLGGPGTSLGFTDGAEDQDQIAVRTLPFNFTFYGQSFNQITICTNGWLAFGAQGIDDFRNYRMGSPIGPANQIAAYWDDLVVTGISNGGVYTWYDATTSRYVVEWRSRGLWSGSDEVFEIILLDPAAYPSPTGDGKILLQYQTVNPVANSGSNDNDYATVGIQNTDHSIGLEYCYFNVYTPGSNTLANGRSIMFTTDISGVVPTSLTLMAPNGGEIWYLHTNATVTWIGGDGGDNVRVELSRNGVNGPWETLTASTPNDGSYDVTVAGPASATCRIRIASVADPGESDTSSANFAISPLEIVSPNGGENWLQDSIVTVSWVGGDPLGTVDIDLSRNGTNGPWTALSSEPNTGFFAWTVTGPSSSTCRVQIRSLGDPADSDTSDADFSIVIIQNVYVENFETGAPGWTHSGAGGQWVDNWNLSTERAFTGVYSYKCGDTGAGNYLDLCDARLTSPVVNNLPADATLAFEHQIISEVSGLYPDSCYDGGLLEISADGGAFTQITPVNGYNKHFRYRTSGGRPYSGPLPGAPCWADTASVWANEVFDLSSYAGQDIQLRWRFCSDSAGTREGWYVDDVLIYAPAVITEPVVPVDVTLYFVAGNLVLRWASDSNTHYRIYSGSTPDNPTEALEGETTTTQFTIPGGAAATKRFYVVVGWDGN